MKFVEYEGRDVFVRHNIPCSECFAIVRLQDDLNNLKINSFPCVIKAQVLAGGRGKAGGVKIAKNRQEMIDIVKKMLGMEIVTHQTAGKTIKVEEVMISEFVESQKEMYIAVTMDRKAAKPVVIACAEGGMSIEELALQKPEAIIKIFVDPQEKLMDFQARELAYALGIEKELLGDFTSLAKNLCKLFIDEDASLAEINPLVITKDGRILAIDSKLITDDNASFRHKQWSKIPDRDSCEIEKEAKEIGINYISLNGNIGCMVNGAGLAMATLDTIKLAGGDAANFLDVGGGANVHQITRAFQIILKDQKVKVIMVNIFGGIMKCDNIASGLIEAAKNVDINVPLVVRLEGTRVKEGKEILAMSGLKIHQASSAWEAAKLAVELAAESTREG